MTSLLNEIILHNPKHALYWYFEMVINTRK